MRYISTRGRAQPLEFEDTLLTGLARDGGLYVPEQWPDFSHDELRAMRGMHYADVAYRIMLPFIGDAISERELGALVCNAYQRFEHWSVAPLVQTGPNEWLMELWHGPTLAFKDVALQLLGLLYDHVLAKRGDTVTLIGATSGDTGSAAIEAFRDREHATIFILHPHNRTSPVQRKQMTTVDSPNVHNIAIEGTFDDCQALVKAMFNDEAFRDEVNMSGVNSINWARVMPQVVYYVYAALQLGGPDRPMRFCVPTGNFGDIYAGYVAAKIGLPIDRLVIASNINDILTRALNTGEHTLGDVTPTMSPSMDIQISSNFERLLFDMYDRDGERIEAMMNRLNDDGAFDIDQPTLARMRELFAAERVDEKQTLATMQEVFKQSGHMIDPHTAVGVAASRRDAVAARDLPMVTLSTAHPAKFPDAVIAAIGQAPPVPDRLQRVMEKEERFDVLDNDLTSVIAHIRDTLAASG